MKFSLLLVAIAALMSNAAALTVPARQVTIENRGGSHEAKDELSLHLAMAVNSQPSTPTPQPTLTVMLGEKAPGAGKVAEFTSYAKLVGDRLYLWGDDVRGKGTLFAVYGFLENCLGVVWPEPGDENIVVRKTAVEIPENWAWSYCPPLRSGMMRGGNLPKDLKDRQCEFAPKELRRTEAEIRKDAADTTQWKLRQKLWIRESMPFGHSFLDWNDKYIDTHPEYLALLANGKRGTRNRGSSDARYMQLCVSNEKVVDQIVTNYVAAGKPKFYNICPNDGSRYFCRCEQCRALDCPLTDDDREMRGDMHLTDRHVNFWNRIAKKIVAIRPDVMLDTYIYSYYRNPPRRERIAYPDNMCFGMVPSAEDDNQAQIREWKACGMKHFKLRPNYLCYRGWIPHGYERFFLENFKLNYREGMIGTDYDGAPRGEVTAFECYAIARVHQDPEIAFAQVEREFLSQYGAAAPVMKRYYDRVRERNERMLYAKQRLKSSQREVVLDDSLLKNTVEAANPTEELEADEAILKEALATPGLTKAERRRVQAMAVLPRHAILTRDFRLAYDSEGTGKMAPDFAEKGMRLLNYRINEMRPKVTPINWGRSFRAYPFEVKYWRQRPLKKLWEPLHPEMGTAE